MRFLVNSDRPNKGSDHSSQRPIVKYFEEGKPMYDFNCFKVLGCSIDPHKGGRTLIFEVDYISKVYKLTGPWIQSFLHNVEEIPALSQRIMLRQLKIFYLNSYLAC